MATVYEIAKKHRTKLSGLVAVVFLALARPTAGTLVAGLAFILCGEAVRIWSSGHIHKNEVLTVTGPYSLTRNPLYVGSFLLGAGFVIGMGLWYIALAYLIFFSGLYWLTIRWEEDKLRKLFPLEWDAYERTVPRFFPLFRIPRYRSGEFRWGQVTRHRELHNAAVVVAVYALLWGKVLFSRGG